MLTGEIRSQIDAYLERVWIGGISNPLEVIEQIANLLFLRRLDELEKTDVAILRYQATRVSQQVRARCFGFCFSHTSSNDLF